VEHARIRLALWLPDHFEWDGLSGLWSSLGLLSAKVDLGCESVTLVGFVPSMHP